jgi:tripartite ATP-independent transporter DctM subunit
VVLALFIVLLLLFFLVGVPAAMALGLTSLIVVAFERGLGDIPYTIIAQRMVYGVNSFPLLAIPFFLLAGKIMNTGGITDRIFTFANTLVGHWRGGLGHVNILSSMIFSGMSGSAVADAMGLGQVEIKAMRQARYDDDFAAAVTAASATIGPIIPPSIPLIIYGVLANVSIAALLIAGLLPGIVLGVCLMIFCYFQARRRNYGLAPRAALSAVGLAFARAFLPILTPVIIIGGMWSGVFTPTEAAAIAAAYALLLTMLVYREMSLADFYRILKETMRDTAVILIIIAAANLYAWLLVFTQIPQQLVAYVTALSTEPLVILLLLNLFLLLIGLFMETNAAITVFTPMLLPLVLAVGIDPVHFGIVMVLNLMIGLVTPPLGMILFAVARVAEMPMDRMVRAVVPYYIPLLIALVLVTYIPAITLLLPGLLR